MRSSILIISRSLVDENHSGDKSSTLSMLQLYCFSLLFFQFVGVIS
jgi:hypothetical protein